MSHINTNKRAQIAPFLILLILLVIGMGTYLLRIGKFGSYKTNVVNACDNGVLAGASELGRRLNQLRQIHCQMVLNHWWLQIYLLRKSPWPDKWAPFHDYQVIMRMEQAREAWESAKEIKKGVKRTVRTALWNNLIGSAAIDEPKPLARPKGAKGPITKEEYSRYLLENSPFSDVLDSLKRYLVDKRKSGSDDYPLFYQIDKFQYYWGDKEYDKDGKEVRYSVRGIKLTRQGTDYYFVQEDKDYYEDYPDKEREVREDTPAFDSFLDNKYFKHHVDLDIKALDTFSVGKRWTAMIYFYHACHAVLPGFMPLPWSGLRVHYSPHTLKAQAKRERPGLKFPYGEDIDNPMAFTAHAQARVVGHMGGSFLGSFGDAYRIKMEKWTEE